MQGYGKLLIILNKAFIAHASMCCTWCKSLFGDKLPNIAIGCLSTNFNCDWRATGWYKVQSL